MKGVAGILDRNRRVIGLFALMVLVPSAIFGVLMVRTVRSERIRAAYEKTGRQRQIVRLLEADLRDWLFSVGAGSASAHARLRFALAGGEIVFPAFDLTLPYSGAPRVRPFESAPAATDRLTAQQVADQYYPRIQAFLRDLSAARNSGAQYFLRLRAMIVRAPGRDEGYVVDVGTVAAYVDERLARLCAGEPFIASIWIGDGENRLPPAGDVFALETFPFFHVRFAEPATSGRPDFRRDAFMYSMWLLGVVTILGSVFMHRAVSQEVRLSRLRSDFVAAVSHEFRSPLSSILALSERLESARVRDEDMIREYSRLIACDARRLSTLVTRLLDFAQIEEGRKVYAFERIELGGLIRDAIDANRHAVRSQRIELASRDGSIYVRADRTALQHCVQNLIENAAKYSPPDAPICVGCRVSNGNAVVEVRDRGIGIPKHEQARIFEKFYRGRHTADLNVEGVGIGLALVKHIADSHQGAVVVESELGQGSCFRLTLPVAEG